MGGDTHWNRNHGTSDISLSSLLESRAWAESPSNAEARPGILRDQSSTLESLIPKAWASLTQVWKEINPLNSVLILAVAMILTIHLCP